MGPGFLWKGTPTLHVTATTASHPKRESTQNYRHTRHHFVTWYLMMLMDSQHSSFHMKCCDTPQCFRLSEQLGTSNSGTLIASNGCVTRKPISWHDMSQWMMMHMSSDFHNHWPWLFDELLLQSQWEYTGKRKYDFEPKCPVGSVQFHTDKK